jgi:hypothetical protein
LNKGITPVIIFTICFYIEKKIIKNKFTKLVSNNSGRNVICYLLHLPMPEKRHPERHFLKFFVSKHGYPQKHCFPVTSKQPVCALRNRLINPQQIAPM